MKNTEQNFMMNFGKAVIFARLAHGQQVRKYTGEPYVNHCRAVAELVLEHEKYVPAVNAALLHDTIEDTSVTKHEIEWFFGKEIGDLVNEVTDVSKLEDGNRAIRKALDREHLKNASPMGKTIKLADLIDNTKSIVENDKGFAITYLKEKRLLLPFLKDGNKMLYKIAENQLVLSEKKLNIRF